MFDNTAQTSKTNRIYKLITAVAVIGMLTGIVYSVSQKIQPDQEIEQHSLEIKIQMESLLNKCVNYLEENRQTCIEFISLLDQRCNEFSLCDDPRIIEIKNRLNP